VSCVISSTNAGTTASQSIRQWPTLQRSARTRKAGFKPVGVMQRYERDADGEGWHDGLLMEFVAD
jgi:hypothetical protein